MSSVQTPKTALATRTQKVRDYGRLAQRQRSAELGIDRPARVDASGSMSPCPQRAVPRANGLATRRARLIVRYLSMPYREG
eukprot:6207982-Pleurochrysis_carterae.AAC.1